MIDNTLQINNGNLKRIISNTPDEKKLMKLVDSMNNQKKKNLLSSPLISNIDKTTVNFSLDERIKKNTIDITDSSLFDIPSENKEEEIFDLSVKEELEKAGIKSRLKEIINATEQILDKQKNSKEAKQINKSATKVLDQLNSFDSFHKMADIPSVFYDFLKTYKKDDKKSFESIKESALRKLRTSKKYSFLNLGLVEESVIGYLSDKNDPDLKYVQLFFNILYFFIVRSPLASNALFISNMIFNLNDITRRDKTDLVIKKIKNFFIFRVFEKYDNLAKDFKELL
jgi:hypothetical protein